MTNQHPRDILCVNEELSAHPGMQSFALARGTSLTLRFGHRISIDLDFFTHEPFENEALAQELTGNDRPISGLKSARRDIQVP